LRAQTSTAVLKGGLISKNQEPVTTGLVRAPRAAERSAWQTGCGDHLISAKEQFERTACTVAAPCKEMFDFIYAKVWLCPNDPAAL